MSSSAATAARVRRRLVIDCDPGQDDAVNLLLAMAAPEAFEVVAITTVAGNVPLELTTRNACLVREIAGREAIPVYAGCASPLRRALVTAEQVHGESGLDGVDIVPTRHGPERENAVDFLVAALRQAEREPLTLVLTGPLTNLATVLSSHPAVAAGIADIVLMGGAARECGNYSPSAEFNMLVDPDAAAIVLASRLPIAMIGLDATTLLRLTPARIERVAALENRVARLVARMLERHGRHDRARYGASGVPLHDPCTIAYLLAPELFAGQVCNVAVETESTLTRGHTAVDFWHVSGREPNVTWVHEVDADGFFELLCSQLARYGGRALQEPG
ncbi:MAG: nucleoside hydrolase [Gammaproteobacteria bacterium]